MYVHLIGYELNISLQKLTGKKLCVLALKYPNDTTKQTLFVGVVLGFSSNSFNAIDNAKNFVLSALLNFGGDSNSNSSNRLKILIFGIDNLQISYSENDAFWNKNS